jgi:hypothetical protein
MNEISPALLTALVSTIKATNAKPEFLAVLFSTLKSVEIEKEPNVSAPLSCDRNRFTDVLYHYS